MVEAMLTVWIPIGLTVLAAVLLHRRRPATTRRALLALDRLAGVAPQQPARRPVPSHVRVVDDAPLAEVIPLRRRSGRAA
jgi:hypothetical protein